MLYRIALAATLVAAISLPAEARGRGGGGGGGGSCNVCGCKGGPGYRAPDGRCVGHRNVKKICGVPATTRCKKESALSPGPATPPRHGTVPNPFS